MKAPNLPYFHVNVAVHQKNKTGHSVCGDIITIDRRADNTLIGLFDGVGSGIKANLAARLNSARFFALLRNGYSIHEAVEKLVLTMSEARVKTIPFAAFTIIKITGNHRAMLISYESPSPIIIENNYAIIPEGTIKKVGTEVIREYYPDPRRITGILVMSDGVSQIGMGHSFNQAWTEETIPPYITGLLQMLPPTVLPEYLVKQVKKISGNTYEDDSSALYLDMCPGNRITILTGPPAMPDHDEACVNDFINAEGIKVICGSSTAQMVSRILNRPIKQANLSTTPLRPPKYHLDGIDLVTEGAVVLNQLYNIIDRDVQSYDPDSCVSELALLINACDLITIKMGRAHNPGHTDIAFTQMGIRRRETIIPMLEKKLRAMGKSVVVEESIQFLR